MAFAWKMFNERDLKNVEELSQKIQNILDNHEKLQNMRAVDLTYEEEEAIKSLVHKHEKKVKNAVDAISELDEEFNAIMTGIAERQGN